MALDKLTEIKLERLKLILREKECPFFSDEELQFQLEENGNNTEKAAYRCLLIKSEDTTLSISGLQAADTSKYFRTLAQQYRGNNSGILSGG